MAKPLRCVLVPECPEAPRLVWGARSRARRADGCRYEHTVLVLLGRGFSLRVSYVVERAYAGVRQCDLLHPLSERAGVDPAGALESNRLAGELVDDVQQLIEAAGRRTYHDRVAGRFGQSRCLRHAAKPGAGLRSPRGPCSAQPALYSVLSCARAPPSTAIAWPVRNAARSGSRRNAIASPMSRG